MKKIVGKKVVKKITQKHEIDFCPNVQFSVLTHEQVSFF